MTQQDIYQTVTNAIIEAIENGQTGDKFTLPWDGGHSGLPVNAATGKAYRGINVPSLWAYQLERGYSSPHWATYKQWKELGAQVKKGEKAASVVFWKAIVVDENQEAPEGEARMIAKWSKVFNAEQVDGYAIPETDTSGGQAETIEEVEIFIRETKADIRRGGNRAYYNATKDYIALPDLHMYRDTATTTATEAYYATALHELTHWTGAESRLDRTSPKRFGDKDYAYEELVAELGAAMLCAMLGITSSTREDHAQYIDGWLNALKNNKTYIFSAASKAQRAVDYLFTLQPQ